jgi:hypothetical protein
MIGDQLPSNIDRLTETTLKPMADRWIAHEGATVVLKAGVLDAVLLRFDGSNWIFTRHLRDSGRACGRRDAFLNLWHWRGAWYVVVGEEIARFDGTEGPGPWTELYENLLAVRSDCASWPGTFSELVPS